RTEAAMQRQREAETMPRNHVGRRAGKRVLATCATGRVGYPTAARSTKLLLSFDRLETERQACKLNGGLARMRSSTSEAICDVFRPMGVDGQGVKDVVDKLLAETSQAQSDTSPPSDVKTLVSRFAHVSDELSCPAGCRNPVRYGHRVGDLSKYATMERGPVFHLCMLCVCECFPSVLLSR
ncbi:unnamed protein product, partial [Effrenium voratum]